MDLFHAIHTDLPREGPGADASTLQALAMIPSARRPRRILDLGCGPGRPTITLAHAANDVVVGVDINRVFLRRMLDHAAADAVADRVTAVHASMDRLPFTEGAFDIIWSEGALYSAGIDRALCDLPRYLRPGGYLAFTELTWLRPDPPREAATYWAAGYPAMRSVTANLDALRATRWNVLGLFTLPEAAWWEYYLPMERRLADLRARTDDATARRGLDEAQFEIEMYRRYSEWYGYVFYVAQAPTDRPGDPADNDPDLKGML